MSFGSCSPEEEMGGQLQKDKIVRHASIREAVKNLLPFWCRVPLREYLSYIWIWKANNLYLEDRGRCGLPGLQANTVAKRPMAQWPTPFSERTPNTLSTLIIMIASRNFYIISTAKQCSYNQCLQRFPSQSNPYSLIAFGHLSLSLVI